MQAALAIWQGVETEKTAGSAICNKLPDMTLIPTPERPPCTPTICNHVVPLFQRLLAVRRPLALDTMLDDPGVVLNLVKRQPLLRVEHQKLLLLC